DVFLFVLGVGRLPADGDDGALAGAGIGDTTFGFFGSAIRRGGVGIGRPLILGPDIATIDHDLAVAIDADEDTRQRHLGRVVNDGALFEGFEFRLDLAEPLIYLDRQLVGLGVFGFEALVLFPKRFPRRTLLVGEIDEAAGERPKAVVVAIGQIGIDTDPLPAFGRDLVGNRLQLV